MAKKASADAARLAEELRQEQEHSQHVDRLRKGLELQIKEMQVRLDEAGQSRSLRQSTPPLLFRTSRSQRRKENHCQIGRTHPCLGTRAWWRATSSSRNRQELPQSWTSCQGYRFIESNSTNLPCLELDFQVEGLFAHSAQFSWLFGCRQVGNCFETAAFPFKQQQSKWPWELCGIE